MAAPDILVNDEIRRQVLLEGVKENIWEEFAPFLKKMEKSIRIRLAEEGTTIRNRTRLNILLRDITGIQKDIYDNYFDELIGDLDDVAITEGQLELLSLNRTVDDFEAIVPAESQLLTAYKQNPLSVRGKSQGLSLKPFLTQFETDQIALIDGMISQGFAEGKTNAQILRDLRGTKATGFTDGVYGQVNANDRIMVRTAVQNSSAQAKQRIWDANNDLVTGVEWVATLDSRTTSQCRSLDGEIFPLDSGPRPPLHFGCRSTTAPVLSDEFDFLTKGAKRPAKGDEGPTQVGAKSTYYGWLKTQPASFQDSILGPNRGKLLRNGGLTSSQFSDLQLNSNFQPRTLEEMATIAPEAFEQANLTT